MSNIQLNEYQVTNMKKYLNLFIKVSKLRGDVDHLELQAQSMLGRLRNGYLFSTDLPFIREMLQWVPELQDERGIGGGCGGGGVIDDMLKAWRAGGSRRNRRKTRKDRR